METNAPKTFKIKPKRIVAVAAAPAPASWTPDPLFTPKTPGEEVDYLVAEWYAARGESVPAAEVDIGAAMDTADRAREEMIAYVNEHYTGEVPPLLYGTSEFWAWIEKQVAELKARTSEEAAVAEAAKPKPAGPKPEFGTPEFWAWARRRKAEKLAEEAAKEAAAAAAGLPSPAAVAAAKKEKVAAKKAAKAQAEAKKAAAAKA